MHKGVKRVLGLGLLAGAGFALWRAMERSRANSGLTWQPRPFPYPPEPRVPEADATAGTAPQPESGSPTEWIEPAAGVCPADHPVKAKLASGIFHQPGGASYARTHADRCYVSAEAAIADGLRPAKR